MDTLATEETPIYANDQAFSTLKNPTFIPLQTSISSKSNIANRSKPRATVITPPSSADTPGETTSVKRQRNTEAARRYRQRKVDRVSDLEDELRKMTQERDELKLKLARAETEADVLRGMVGNRS